MLTMIDTVLVVVCCMRHVLTAESLVFTYISIFVSFFFFSVVQTLKAPQIQFKWFYNRSNFAFDESIVSPLIVYRKSISVLCNKTQRTHFNLTTNSSAQLTQNASSS